MKKGLIFLLAYLFQITGMNAMPGSGSWAEPGHRQATHLVLEGVSGLDAIYARVNSGIDSDFYKRFKETFGSYPSGNHRVIGHWGFSGAIPFNEIPYKDALKDFPKDKIIEFWRNYVTSMTDEVMKMTGLEKKQAQALAGLIYNTHLLCDYTGAELTQLPRPERLLKDIGTNLHALFGNRSAFVDQVMDELSRVPFKNLNDVEKAQRIYQILAKYNIGEKFVKTYESVLTEKGISFAMNACKQALYAKAAQGINAKYFQSALAQALTTGDGKTLRPNQIKTFNYMKRVQGVVQEVNKNGRKAYVLSIPLQFRPEERIASKIAKELLEEALANGHKIDDQFILNQITTRLQKEFAESLGKQISPEVAEKVALQSLNWAKINPERVGFQAGVMTFVIIEGVTVYRFAGGDMDDETFAKETSKNLGGAFLTGGATYCAVILGATPTGWVVVGIGIGVNVAWDLAFNQLDKEFSTPEITMDDILGVLPTELQRRKDVWSYSGFSCIYDYQGKAESLFEPSMGRETAFEPNLEKPGTFDYTPQKKTIFE